MSSYYLTSNMSSVEDFYPNLNLESIINSLEDETYLKPEFNNIFKNEVKTKIEEFSHWFNSTARLYLLRCGPEENEMYVYLLLNLKKKLKSAISEINKSISKRPQSYLCNVCEENIDIQSWDNVWSRLQDHPHFEECYTNIINKMPNTSTESIESDESSISNDSGEELNQIAIPNENKNVEEQDVNDFKFDLTVIYDQRIEEYLYPESLRKLVEKKNNLLDYSVQRCAVNRGTCLLCPCNLKAFKITPYVIKKHVFGRKHMKHAATLANTGALEQYHEFWRSQEAAYQAHQIHFVPEITRITSCKCQLCSKIIPYSNVIKHIKNKSHRNKVLKLFNSSEQNPIKFYLLDLQVEIYDNFVNHDTPKKEEKTRGNKSDGTGKCDVVKVVIKPNQIHLPPRYKDHLEFLTKYGDLVCCRLCKISFLNSTTVIRNHILNAQHSQLSGIPPLDYTFFCGICKLQLKDEDAWDEHFIKGPNRHDTLPQARRLKVAEHECKTCNFVIYGDEFSISSHVSSSSGKSIMKEVKKVKKVSKPKNSREDAEQQVTKEKTIKRFSSEIPMDEILEEMYSLLIELEL